MSNQTKRQPDTGQLLRTLFEATATATGEEFFRALVRRLAESLQARCGVVAELVGNGARARTLAIWLDNDFRENVEYPVADTPCERVYLGDIVQINTGIQGVSPGEGLYELLADSYIGVPLKSCNGEVIGHVMAMDDKPMVAQPHDFSTLESFAARASAELQRLVAEQELSRAQHRLMFTERLASIGRLVAGISHEVNNPLSAVRSYAEASASWLHKLKEKDGGSDLPTERIEALAESSEAAIDACRRIGAVVERLSHFSGIDAANLRDYDVQEGLEAALAYSYAVSRLDLSLVRDFSAVPTILADSGSLNHAFATLLRHATETPNGQSEIRIATRAADEHVEIEIYDNGEPLSDSELANLFDFSFGSAQQRIALRAELALAHDIIVSHGGSVVASCPNGRGTRFEVRLPLQPAPQN